MNQRWTAFATRQVLGLMLLIGPCGGARAQPGQADVEKRAYDFVGEYFQRYREVKPYRLDVNTLPVVSPYGQHFDLSKTLSNEYLTANQFLTRVKTDSLLAEADFAAMRQQLAYWQKMRKWRASRLRARWVRVMVRDGRSQSERLLPKFTTYQVFPPLFSRDGRTVLFYVENFCGLECAGGQIDVWHRQADGTWRRVLAVATFMS